MTWPWQFATDTFTRGDIHPTAAAGTAGRHWTCGANSWLSNSQNHDQIGNRAKGERLSMLLKPLQLKAVAALTILSPFVPLLFQGEEWGASTPFFYFTDHQDKALGQLVTEGRRQEFATFGWADDVADPQLPDTFERSRLDWSELRSPEHRDILTWYWQIIALRGSNHQRVPLPVDVSHNLEASWLWFICGDLCVAVNFASEPANVVLPQGSWRLLLSSVPDESHGTQFGPLETRIYARHV